VVRRCIDVLVHVDAQILPKDARAILRVVIGVAGATFVADADVQIPSGPKHSAPPLWLGNASGNSRGLFRWTDPRRWGRRSRESARCVHGRAAELPA
jgi:hypothetical protein